MACRCRHSGWYRPRTRWTRRLRRSAIKAQAHTGGRGKAGGVRLVEGRDAALAAINSMLGMRLVTEQTGSAGKPVNELLVETPTEIAAEFYLGLAVDRTRRRMVLM